MRPATVTFPLSMGLHLGVKSNWPYLVFEETKQQRVIQQ